MDACASDFILLFSYKQRHYCVHSLTVTSRFYWHQRDSTLPVSAIILATTVVFTFLHILDFLEIYHCLMLGRSCSVEDERENIDRLRASSERHKRQLKSNQLDVRKSEQKMKDLTINIRYVCIKPYLTWWFH